MGEERQRKGKKTGLYQTRREFSGLIQPFSMEK
jgi:hypothetical protein